MNRLVWVLGSRQDPDTKAWSKICHGVGMFLGFGVSYDHDNDRNVVQYTVAMVEYPDGTVSQISTEYIQFMKDGESEWQPPKAK